MTSLFVLTGPLLTIAGLYSIGRVGYPLVKNYMWQHRRKSIYSSPMPNILGKYIIAHKMLPHEKFSYVTKQNINIQSCSRINANFLNDQIYWPRHVIHADKLLQSCDGDISYANISLLDNSTIPSIETCEPVNGLTYNYDQEIYMIGHNNENKFVVEIISPRFTFVPPKQKIDGGVDILGGISMCYIGTLLSISLLFIDH